MFIMQVTPPIPVGYFDVVSIVAFISILLVVWNMSRKFTTLENDAKTGKEQHYTDIKDIKDKIQSIEKDLIQRISDAKVERKEEIASALGNNVAKFENLQKQIDSARSDMKDVSTRVTTVNTKTEHIENEIIELKDCDSSNHRFHIEEHRITNNKIEILRSEFINMFTSFHAPKEIEKT